MRGLVLRSLAEGPQLEDIQTEGPLRGELAVRIAAAGVCGSDLHVLHGRSAALVLPSVLGHEAAGVVEAVGPAVTGVSPGDHVILVAVGSCQQCPSCIAGRPMLCTSPNRALRTRGLMPDGRSRLAGRGGTDLFAYAGIGAMAETVIIPEQMVVGIPDDVPLDVVAPIGCGVMTGLGAALNTARPEPGDCVLVFGCGGVGLNVIQGCRLSGAGQIIAVDKNQARLQLAADFGATHCVDPAKDDVESVVRRLRPDGVDIAYEVVGRTALLAQAFSLLRPRGTCVVVGFSNDEPFAVPPAVFLATERRLTGSFFGSCDPRRDVPRFVGLYRSGRIKLDELVTHRYPLADFAAAFRASEEGDGARSVLTM